MPLVVVVVLAALWLWPGDTGEPPDWKAEIDRRDRTIDALNELVRIEEETIAGLRAEVAAGRPPPPAPAADRARACAEVPDVKVVYLTKEDLEAPAGARTIAADTRIVPGLVDGVRHGVKLYAIRPGTFWARLGVENGDLVVWPASLDGWAPYFGAAPPVLMIERHGCAMAIVPRIVDSM